MRITVTGASGFVGQYIAAALVDAGHEVSAAGRRAIPGLPHIPWQLGEALPRTDCIVHSAFLHVPGKFRGGEGEDPEGFWRANVEGSLRLPGAADRFVFLSSRAVFDGWPPGTKLPEDLAPRPTSLYGEAKVAVEKAVLAQGGTVIRATGIVGRAAPGHEHKWAPLFAEIAAGQRVAPRVATETYGEDIGRLATLAAEGATGIFHAPCFLLDRRDLAAAYARVEGISCELPPRADASRVSMLQAERALGLSSDWLSLRPDIDALVAEAVGRSV